jgi:hypothetical protein
MLYEEVVPKNHFLYVGDINALMVVFGQYLFKKSLEAVVVFRHLHFLAVIFFEDGLKNGLERHFSIFRENGDVVEGGDTVVGECGEAVVVFQRLYDEVVLGSGD